MHDQERSARALTTRLEPELPGSVLLVGAGVNWHVELTRGDRCAAIRCFWYDDAAALMLGANPSNARTRPIPPRPAYRGAEYLLTLSEHGARASGGRTRVVDDAAACALAWVRDEAALGELHCRWSFVDASQRALFSLHSRLAASAGTGRRCAIESDVVRRELWVYGDGRSCEVAPGDGERATVRFLLGPAPVARLAEVSRPEHAVALWIEERCTLEQLDAAGAVLEPHAEVLEQGEAGRWSWLHLTDRLKDHRDSVAWARGLIARLIQRPVATEFFTFSSVTSLCFSASSHYPWVRKGLPSVWPSGDEQLVVDVDGERAECDVETAVELIEATLARAPVRPFFGSATMLELAEASAALARVGARVPAQLRQRMSWLEVIVAESDREARLLGSAVIFSEAGVYRASGSYPSPDHAASAACQWVEARTAVEAIAADPHVLEFRRWHAQGEIE